MAALSPHTHFGIAGGSARARAESIRVKREQAAAERSGAARVLRTVFGPTAAERRSIEEEGQWATGAAGEEMLAGELARRCPDVTVMHDLRMPGTRANIDHVAIARSGVYVIDAKRYRGQIRVEKRWLSGAKLVVAGRDRTHVIESLDKQVATVRRAVAASDAGEVAVHGCLCFLRPERSDVGLPAIRTLSVNGYPLYYARRLCKQLNERGSLTPEMIEAVRDELARRLARSKPT